MLECDAVLVAGKHLSSTLTEAHCAMSGVFQLSDEQEVDQAENNDDGQHVCKKLPDDRIRQYDFGLYVVVYKKLL